MSHRLTFVVALLGLALGAPAAAPAQSCAFGCGDQLKACVRNSRADAFACKLDCLANPPAEGRRACVKSCGDTSHATRRACKSALLGCLDTCAPTAITADQQSCLAPCGTALGDCARAVIDDTRTCLVPCRDAGDRAACWRDCVGGARDGATTCAGDFNVCASACGVIAPPLPTPPVGDACSTQCGTDLTQCLTGVAQTGLACGGACFGGPNPFPCLLDCKASAEAGATACRDTFDGCRASCAP